MSSNCCQISKQLHVINSIKRNVVDSPSLTADVKNSLEIVIESIKLSVKKRVVQIISIAIENNEFKKNTDAHQAAINVYKFDIQLYNQVIKEVFTKIDLDENFKIIIDSLNSLEESGAIVEGYCKLFDFISYISEHLWAFECAVRILLKDGNSRPSEKLKLDKLLNDIKEYTHEHVKHLALISQFEDMM